MRSMRRAAIFLGAFLVSTAALDAGPAVAQAERAAPFPTRAVKIIVPFPPGGPTDVNIRIIAQRMSEDWKQPVVIDNRPPYNMAVRHGTLVNI
jgi:tripartite-type tricarboxylate transporter receptor subunit TctC